MSNCVSPVSSFQPLPEAHHHQHDAQHDEQHHPHLDGDESIHTEFLGVFAPEPRAKKRNLDFQPKKAIALTVVAK